MLHGTWPSSRPGSAEVFHDRALHFRLSFERKIAHVEIVSQGAAERVELALSRFELSHLSRQEVTDIAAAPAAGVGFVTHEVADLAQGQPMRLGLFDESHALDGLHVVLSEP